MPPCSDPAGDGATPQETLRHPGTAPALTTLESDGGDASVSGHPTTPKAEVGLAADAHVSLGPVKLSGTSDRDGESRTGYTHPAHVILSRSGRDRFHPCVTLHMSHIAVIGAGITGVTTALRA